MSQQHITHIQWKLTSSAENCPNPGSHIVKQTRAIYKVSLDIIRKDDLTKFHEDRTINMTSRVLTRTEELRHERMIRPSFANEVQDIIGKNPLIKFHEDRTINVTFRVLTM
ncbi:hypothetical protein DPMN_074182 [Dreissena polymorpha]|uniref:Uncharacterized protein n=1 Tax=Dreissena polymorpha TaxID=45954 RepID=A0A9D4BLE5_DREPO|nr:hypothetical protein DPMN_074182 [Dreissena polymorpha]